MAEPILPDQYQPVVPRKVIEQQFDYIDQALSNIRYKMKERRLEGPIQYTEADDIMDGVVMIQKLLSGIVPYIVHDLEDHIHYGQPVYAPEDSPRLR